MGIETALIIGGLAAAGGTGYGMINANRERQHAKGVANQAKEREQNLADERDANIAKINEQYGVGGTDQAQQNHQTIADAIKQYYLNSLLSGQDAAENQFATSSRVSRQNLARAGQLGGGLDSTAQSGTLADFLRARQKSLTDANGAKEQFMNNLTSQRLGFVNQISSGTATANPDFQAIIDSKNSLLHSAQNNVLPTAIGKMFTTAGDTYSTGMQQGAMGNSGLKAFNFTGNNAGRIS